MNIDEIVSILKHKKQIILQGAPGTGKTYNTAAVALRLMNVPFDIANHEEMMAKYQDLVDQKRISFTTFHQAMDYEDFIEGLKPEVENGGVVFNVQNGIFKQICENASNVENVDISVCIKEFLQTIKGFDNRKSIPTINGKSAIEVWWNQGNTTICGRSLVTPKEDNKSDIRLNIDRINLQAIGEGRESNWPAYAQAFINAVKKEYNIGKDVSELPYVLIIDEINRGNISKIFGELITLLEADKRTSGSHSIMAMLPYSKEQFSVPSNLYIIGTMNTTDRSVGHIDYAVRRRFSFYTLKASEEAVRSFYNMHAVNAELSTLAVDLFKRIYKFVEEHVSDELDVDDMMVGHSYFMASTKEELLLKLKYEVIPLLREYEKDGFLSLSSTERVELGEAWMQLI